MSRTILVVDTNGETLTALSRVLSEAGFAVTPAGDFEDATALLRTERFDYLLTAVRLGAHNGLHLVLRARSDNPTGVTVVFTAAADPVLSAEARSFGAEHMVAPWEAPAELVSTLNRLKEAQPL
jgi:two-component system, chemotaxis family, chemotaxis protein CheY